LRTSQKFGREKKGSGRMNTHLHFQELAAGVAILLASAGLAGAQVPAGSLTVENQTALTDVIGRTLPGTWGFPDAAVRVEIRKTVSGGMPPPNPATGEGEPENLVQASCMGKGILGSNPGRFSEVFTNRLGSGSFYARVYDQPAAGGSLYYRDSTAFTDDGAAQYAYPNFAGSPWNLVNTNEFAYGDSDGDGVPDALESTLGLDPGNPDTDGDGYPDLFELLYADYLNPTEPDAPFEVAIDLPAPAESDPYIVSWDTIPVPGMEYRLEYTDALPFEEEFTETIWSGTATDTQLIVDVDEWVRTNSLFKGFFRVWAGP
jgi:hypothetical protein